MVQHRELGSRNRAAVRWVVVMAAVLTVATAQSATAQNYTTLYTFKGMPDGNEPQAGVLQDPQGNLYGTTAYGGSSNLGTVFKIDSSGDESILYSFAGPPDGTAVIAPLLRDSVGNLYGVSSFGGAFGYGLVYEVSNLDVETILYSFTGTGGDAYPGGGLIRDSAGNLYGVTGTFANGPCSQNCGTVFKLAPNGAETVLHSFSGTNGDGAYPQGLAADKKGNLYGFTFEGGDLTCERGSGCGAVFKIDNTGKETILYSFEGGSTGLSPGGAPVLDPSGNIYGTTSDGGDAACVLPGWGGIGGCGIVFKVSPAGKETVLHAFLAGPAGLAPMDGAIPNGGLARDSAGNLYGSTIAGGNHNCWNSNGCGVIFELSRTGRETILYVVPEYQIAGPLTRASSGILYGTAGGGNLGQGSVFEFTLN